MPSPVAHSLAGLCAYEACKDRFSLRPRHAALFVLFSGLPDAHYLPAVLSGVLFRQPPVWLHSLVAAGSVFLIGLAAVMPWGRRRAILWAATAGLLYALHILMDWLSLNRIPGNGPVVLWPYSQEPFTAPFHLFRDLRKGDVSAILGRENILKVLWEALVMGGAFLGVRALRARGFFGPKGAAI